MIPHSLITNGTGKQGHAASASTTPTAKANSSFPNAAPSDPRLANFRKDTLKPTGNSPVSAYSPDHPSPASSEKNEEPGIDFEGSLQHVVNIFAGVSKYSSHKELLDKREKEHANDRAHPNSKFNLSLHESQQEIKHMKASVARRESEVRAAWKGLDPELHKYVSAIVDVKVGSVTQEVQELKKLVQEQRELVGEQKKLTDEQREQLEEKERRIAGLERRGQTFEDQSRDVSNLRTRLHEQDQKVASAQKEAKDCSEQLWTSIDEARKEKETFQQQIQNVSKSLEESNKQLDDFKSKLEGSLGNGGIAQLSEKVQALEIQVQSSGSETEEKMRSADQTFREFENRTQSLESGMEQAKTQVAGLQPVIDSLAKDVSSVKQTHSLLGGLIDMQEESAQNGMRKSLQNPRDRSEASGADTPNRADASMGFAEKSTVLDDLSSKVKTLESTPGRIEAIEKAQKQVSAQIEQAAGYHGKRVENIQRDITELQNLHETRAAAQSRLTDSVNAIETYTWSLGQRIDGFLLEPFLRAVVHEMRIMYPYPDEYARRLNELQESVNRFGMSIQHMQRATDDRKNEMASMQRKVAAVGGPSSAVSSQPASPTTHDSCAAKFRDLQDRLIGLNQLFASKLADLRKGGPNVNGQAPVSVDLTGNAASGKDPGAGSALARINSFTAAVEALQHSYQRFQGDLETFKGQVDGFNVRIGSCEGKLEIHEGMLATALAEKLPPPQAPPSKAPGRPTPQQELEMAQKTKGTERNLERLEVHDSAIERLRALADEHSTMLQETMQGVASIREKGEQLEKSLHEEVTAQGQRLDQFQSDQEKLNQNELYPLKAIVETMNFFLLKTHRDPATPTAAAPAASPLKHPLPGRAANFATGGGSRRGTPSSVHPTVPAPRGTPSTSASTTPTTERRNSFFVDQQPPAGRSSEARDARGSSKSSNKMDLGNTILGAKGRKRARHVSDDEDDSGSYRPTHK